MPGCQDPRNGSVSSIDGASWRRTLWLSLADAGLATTMTTLVGGVFLTGFALVLGASQLQIGVLAALPTLANVAQIAGSYFIERTGQRKPLCLWSTGIARGLWGLILALPFLGLAGSGTSLVWWIVLALALSSAFTAVGGVAWLSWIKDLVPVGRRSDFLSRRNQVGTAVSLSLSILAGLFLDWWGHRSPGSVVGFTLVFGFATLCGLAGIWFLRATPESPMPRPERHEPLSKLFALPLADSNFRRLVLFYAYWNLGMYLSSPFFNVYMLTRLELPFWYVTLLSVESGVAGLLTNRFWVRLSERFGNKPIVFLTTLGNAFFPLWWIFIDRESVWLLLLVHMSGVFNSPLVLGPNNIILKLAPDRSTSAYLAVFNAVIGPVTAVAPILGGLVAVWMEPAHIAVGPLMLGPMKVVFLLSFVGRLTSLFLLRRVVEPEAEPVRRVLPRLKQVKGLLPVDALQAALELVVKPRSRSRRVPAPHFTRGTVSPGRARAREPGHADDREMAEDPA